MVKINYKSDFKINEKSETIALEVPFVFSYYVFDSKKYVVSFDGHNYVNCERKEDGSLDVIFNKPEFGIGHLKVERKYAVDDKAFADGVFDVVTVDKSDVFITSGKTFETYIETLVVPPFLKGDKGDPMTWDTMTETERGELVHDVAEAIDPEMVMTENEKARQEAERSRQTAEQQRSSTFNTLNGKMQSAITAGNTAAGNAQKVVDNYDAKVAEQDSKLTELGSEVDDFKETITNQVNNYKPIEINGNVTNAADEEDITSDENNLLKLKDRNNLNGMGYVILRKNKILSEQLTQTNTIYDIRYNFDLDGSELNVPEGCVLKFNGGSISNGKIVGNNTIIDSSPIHIFNNIELSGSFGLEYYVEWFGASSKILNNEVVFNHAITQINKTSSGGILLINGRYVISDTVYLRNGVSLKCVFTLDAEYSANPKDNLKGAALLFNFNDTSKWVIDTFTYQKDSTEQGIIDAKTLHVTYEGLGWGHIRKCGWLIEDISIQAYKANTDAVKYCLGGIRLGQIFNSVVSRVYIYDVAVGMCINLAWGTTIKDCTIIAYYIGLYAGYLVTDINVNNCVINRTYYGNSFYVEDKPNFLSTNTIPPYVDELISCAIVVESSGTDLTKLHLQDVIVQLYNGFLIANGGDVYVSNLYLESVNDFIAWTYSGKIVIDSTKYLFKKTNNYTYGTETGTIVSDGVKEVKCYSSQKTTINDNRYIIKGGFMWYDDYTIDNGVATPIKKCPVKHIKMEDYNTYYIGYYSSTKYFDYNYSVLASGEHFNCPTPFTEIVNRGITKAKLLMSGLTDIANVEIKNSEYTIIPSVNSNYPKRLYQSKPIVLKDSKLILGKNGNYQTGFSTIGDYDKNLDGKTYDVTQRTHTFEVEGNCELSFSAYIAISEGNEGYAPIKLIGTRPINLKVYLPNNYYTAKSMFLNLDYTTRYHIEVFYPNGNVVTFVNETKPMNGNKIGDTWIEDGKPIYWTGTKWVDATGIDV